MDGEELPLLSSSPLLTTAPVKTRPEDEKDLPTLKRVQEKLKEQIQSYSTIDRLVVDEKDLSVKEQLAVNKAIVFHLRELELLVDTVIENVKEKYSE